VRLTQIAFAVFCLVPAVHGATETERLRNDRVTVVEYKLNPGETVAWEGMLPAVTVYLEAGTLSRGDAFAAKSLKVERGQAAFSPAGPETVRNAGDSPIGFVRVEFRDSGSRSTWGKAGLAPHYKLLLENAYARVYEIRIPAGAKEPQHTHHDRVVICLSGATLKHILPDGKEETATLETGEIAWRPGATHVGQNLGNTDLWVVAVEPK
jgi:quercetin dioxygenase-like cupin family protein